MKKLLMLANYYAPENASVANLYTELAESLKSDFEITVICEIPCYKGVLAEEWKRAPRFTHEDRNGIKVIRVRVSEFQRGNKIQRVRHVLSYFLNSFFCLFSIPKQDVILAVSQPPVLGGVLGFFAKKITHGKLVYNIQDFNPEQIEITRYSSSNFIVEVLRVIDNFVCRKCDSVVVVSNDMQKTLQARMPSRTVPQNVVISNWVDTNKVFPVERKDNPLIEKYGLSEESFLVVYAGNIGYMQNLSTVIYAAEKLQSLFQIQFVFIGDGAEKEKLELLCKRKKLRNVLFFPLESLENVNYVYNLGDIELVSIGKGVTKCSMPSKTWNVLAAGKIVLCQTDTESELASMIHSNRLGTCFAPGDSSACAQAIQEYFQNRNAITESKTRNRSFVKKYYSRESACELYRKLLSDL